MYRPQGAGVWSRVPSLRTPHRPGSHCKPRGPQSHPARVTRAEKRLDRSTQDLTQGIVFLRGSFQFPSPPGPRHLGLQSLLPQSTCAGSVVSNCFVTPWTVARQTPLSMEFSQQEYWSGLPFPPAGDLPNPGMEPASPVSPALAGGFFTAEPPGKAIDAGKATSWPPPPPRT